MNEIHYMVTVEDIAHLNHFHQNHSKRWKRARHTAMGVGFGMLFLAAALMVLSGTSGLGVLLIWGSVLTVPLLIRKFRKNPSRGFVNQMRRIFSEGRNMTLFGNHHIKLLEDHMEVRTDYSNTKIKWEGIENVVQDEHYIYIYTSALNAHVINKKYFATEDDAQMFFRLAEQLHQQGLYRLEGPAAPLALPAPPVSQPTTAPNRLLPKPSPQGIDGSI